MLGILNKQGPLYQILTARPAAQKKSSSATHSRATRRALAIATGFIIACVALPAQPLAMYNFTSIARSNSSSFEGLFAGARLTNAGSVVFAALNSDSQQGIFVHDGANIAPVVDPADGQFLGAFGYNISKNTGLVVFHGNPVLGAPGVFSADGSGFFTEIVNDTDSVSQGDIEFLNCVNGCDIADDGTVAFLASTDGGNGIYSGSGGPTVPFAVDSGALRVPFGDGAVAINNAGQIATVVDTPTPGEALIVGPLGGGGGGPFDIVIPSGTTVFRDFTSLALADNGSMAFTAVLDSGEEGVYSVGNTGVVTTIADTTGVFQRISDVAFNEFGQVIFYGELDAGGGRGLFTGADPTADNVIWVGDQIFSRTVTVLTGNSLTDDSINDPGQLAFSAFFNDGRIRIVRADPDIEAQAIPRELLDGFTQLSTANGTGVGMSQFLPLPVEPFDLSLDFQFLTDFGMLSLMLGELDLGIFGPEDSGSLFFPSINPLDLFNPDNSVPDGVLLNLLLTGGIGATVRIDDIVLPGIVNGDFETGYFDNWDFDRSLGGVAVVSAFDTPSVPVPGVLALFSIGLAGFGLARSRKV